MLKNYLKSYIYLITSLIIFTIIFTIINYFTTNSLSIIKILIPIISILISSFILGKNTKSKAYLEGIKFSLIYLIFTTILKLILKISFNYKTFIIYLVIILSSIIGSTIGINTKKN